MKRASVGLVVLFFVTSVISSVGSSAGRTLNANEAAALWGRGELCHNGDPMCTATVHCAGYFPCELGKEQTEMPGPEFECLAWPFNNRVCSLNTPVVCLVAVGCEWEETSEICQVDPLSIPWGDANSFQGCALLDPPDFDIE